jgi:hypothetical protein
MFIRGTTVSFVFTSGLDWTVKKIKLNSPCNLYHQKLDTYNDNPTKTTIVETRNPSREPIVLCLQVKLPTTTTNLSTNMHALTV